jgi:hypothetical protein
MAPCERSSFCRIRDFSEHPNAKVAVNQHGSCQSNLNPSFLITTGAPLNVRDAKT